MMFIKFVGRIIVAIILCLIVVLPVRMYIRAWKYVIESYNLIWDTSRGFFQNIFTNPDEDATAFAAVHIFCAAFLGIFVFIGFAAWVY